MKFTFKLLDSDCIGCGEVTRRKSVFSQGHIEYMVPFCTQCNLRGIDPEQVILHYHDYDAEIRRRQRIIDSIKEEPKARPKKAKVKTQRPRPLPPPARPQPTPEELATWPRVSETITPTYPEIKGMFEHQCPRCKKTYNRGRRNGPMACADCWPLYHPPYERIRIVWPETEDSEA
jgi:hypothetical protein